MTVDELIEELNKMKSNHGNVEVRYATDDGETTSVTYVDAKTIERFNFVKNESKRTIVVVLSDGD